MDLLRFAALVGFVGVVGVVVYVVVRSRAAGRENREAQAFAEAVAALSARVLAALEDALAIVDGVRRRRSDASGALPAVGAALAAIDGFVADVRALPVPRPSADIRDALEADLRRAERALDRADHGCRMLVTRPGRGADLEGQSSVKRGYLELQHARDAFARHAAEVARIHPTAPDRAEVLTSGGILPSDHDM